MSNDLNLCQFIGRLGRDVEMRYLPSGEAVASFSLALGASWKTKEGEKKELTEWVNISAFGNLAEICGKYLVKGSQVYISGKIKSDKYTDKDGVEKYMTKIIARDMQMLGGKSDRPAQTSQDPVQPSEPKQYTKSIPSGTNTPASFADFEGEIPF